MQVAGNWPKALGMSKVSVLAARDRITRADLLHPPKKRRTRIKSFRNPKLF